VVFRRASRGKAALGVLALVSATFGCGPDTSSGAERRGGAAEGGADRAAAGGAGLEPRALLGRWEGLWVEEWASGDLPPDLRLPDAVRSPGTVTIDAVADGRAFGTWTAVDRESEPERLARGRFTAEVSGAGWTLRGGRFTSRGVQVIATADLGSGCPLVEEEAFHGGLGPGANGGLLLAARRTFRCREPASGSSWTVEARWTFYGRPP